MTDTLHIVPLTASHIDSALRLSTQAGWNQLDHDWLRLIETWPRTCYAGMAGDRLVATATLACYGSLGWIGMILVDAEHRGRGHARAMMEHTLAAAKARGVTTLALDATDEGRPVYLKQGFTDHSTITRWSGPAVVSGDHGTTPATFDDWTGIAALDRAAHGVDRLTLLQALAQEPGATCRVVRESGKLVGFGFSRRGRGASMVGPVVATQRDVGVRLARELMSDRAADQPQLPVIIDLPGAGDALAPGLEPRRTLTRMSLPATTESLLTGEMVIAAAGFELG